MNGAHVAFEGRHRACACEGGVYVLIVAAAAGVKRPNLAVRKEPN